MIRKWRPSLSLVLGGALCGTLLLSQTGLAAFRYLGPEVEYRNAAIVLAILITLATAILGWLLIRLLLRAIKALERFAKEVRSAPVAPLTPPTHFGTVELQTTAKSVIDMANTLRNRETTIRSFSDYVTHELKTPIASLQAATELLRDGGAMTAGDMQLVNQIAGAGNQMKKQIEGLQQAAQAREACHEGFTTLDNMRDELKHEFPTLQLQIEGGEVAIPLSQLGLGIVLRQLLGNSLNHGSQTVRLATSVMDTSVRILVEDDGLGVSPGNAKRIFEPFFTSNREQGGTGMGLAIARNTLRAHGGDISHLPKNEGATFLICFAVR